MLLYFTAAFSQGDSTQTLFKHVKYSYAQCDLGYVGMPYKNDFMNGFGIHFGAVMNKKLFAGIGVETYSLAGVPAAPYPTSSSSTLSVTYASLDLEYLHHPNKLFNFSIPVRTCYTSTQYSNVYITNYSGPYDPKVSFTDHFLTMEAGLNVFVNLIKQISLGVGGSYRYAVNVGSAGTNEDFSGYSVTGMLRFKLYSREWYDAQVKKQQEMMKQMNNGN